ncbi:hypothetical protein M427DRAFT_70103 [Gonapodya prolifera JEL478]|uniref:Prolyl 4-hydroxylase alpha subunit Fe(2+) 2OG dioxygenase domain-containing protein n=1 Tax=Gonapodya prolifera (strain JEL478) TaxID=1344416 RepID=A0A139AES5_GONPJ|nr:hypothetical protein M427DRAFT_70103 [Gonapodya prolifera JEL478]|eukprot:KXS15250.1 hypothetical protein M427DRAFT_70103 [Gonapodya prolifera JEL478]
MPKPKPKRPVKPPSSVPLRTTSIPRPFALGAVLCLCLAIVAWYLTSPTRPSSADSPRHETRKAAPVYVRTNETIDKTWDVECKGGSWVGDEVVPGCTPPPCRRHATYLPSTSLTPLRSLIPASFPSRPSPRHPHIDKLQYGSFTYTALIYLSSLHTNFTGGRFFFHDSTVVEPSFGLLSSFTSGAENVHWVEKVETGERWAFTCAFTCGKGKGKGSRVNLEDVRRWWSDEFED